MYALVPIIKEGCTHYDKFPLNEFEINTHVFSVPRTTNLFVFSLEYLRLLPTSWKLLTNGNIGRFFLWLNLDLMYFIFTPKKEIGIQNEELNFNVYICI